MKTKYVTIKFDLEDVSHCTILRKGFMKATDMAKTLGVSNPTVCNWEKGTHLPPSPVMMDKYRDILVKSIRKKKNNKISFDIEFSS